MSKDNIKVKSSEKCQIIMTKVKNNQFLKNTS